MKRGRWVGKDFIKVCNNFAALPYEIGISIYPPSPLPLVKEGGIFTKRKLLIETFFNIARASKEDKSRKPPFPPHLTERGHGKLPDSTPMLRGRRVGGDKKRTKKLSILLM
jgi:hypothetical protein